MKLTVFYSVLIFSFNDDFCDIFEELTSDTDRRAINEIIITFCMPFTMVLVIFKVIIIIFSNFVIYFNNHIS